MHKFIGKRVYWALALAALLVLAGGVGTAAAGSATASGGGGGEREVRVAPGQLDDGKDLLPRAGITLERAIAAARAAASGPLGEVDLEYYQERLVFNVDIGDQDVKVDALSGVVLAVAADD
jgi:uncharacterized membrane protein YkoI